jgi:hypothetical protein
MSLFYRNEVTDTSLSYGAAIRRQIVPQIWMIVALFVLASCYDGAFGDSVPRTVQLCVESGGETVTRPLLDGSGREIGYCVFEDGTECHIRQINYGTCLPPGADAPIGPVSTPVGGYGNTPFNSGFPDYDPPPSLQILIENAPLILIGEVGQVERYTGKLGYGEDGQIVTPTPGTDLAPPSVVRMYPATDFRIEVEQVLRDDGTIAADKPVILRVLGHVTEELKQSTQEGLYPVTYTGDHYLFLLTPYPDGQTYGFYYGPWSRLIIDGDIILVPKNKTTC